MPRSKITLILALFTCSFSVPLPAAIIIKNGQVWNADNVATLSPEEHYDLAVEAFEKNEWNESAKQFQILIYNFPNHTVSEDAHFFLGASLFHLSEFDLANVEFTTYLKAKNHPKYFQETIEYKFCIAESFKNGARAHMFGYKQLPRVFSNTDLAHEVYNEVIASVPCHEIAAKSLFSKGELHWKQREYREAVDCFTTIIRRFSKHELAPVSYLTINSIYLEQSQKEFHNPDILALAELNLKKFKRDFPGEERVTQAEANVLSMKEIYANGLYETGQYYERVSQPQASMIYYRNAIKKFPETHVAELCKMRLNALGSTTSG